MKNSKVFILIACVVAIMVLGSVSGLANIESLKNWFPTLNRPPLNPPNWIFGPVWTLLYFLMGISFYQLIIAEKSKTRTIAIQLFVVQFALNMAWSFIFFYMHALGLALIEISILWILILSTIYVAKKVKPIAAYLLIPYIFWVSFATYLTAAYFVLN